MYDDKKELVKVVADILKRDHGAQYDKAPYFYNDLMNRLICGKKDRRNHF